MPEWKSLHPDIVHSETIDQFRSRLLPPPSSSLHPSPCRKYQLRTLNTGLKQTPHKDFIVSTTALQQSKMGAVIRAWVAFLVVNFTNKILAEPYALRNHEIKVSHSRRLVVRAPGMEPGGRGFEYLRDWAIFQILKVGLFQQQTLQ